MFKKKTLAKTFVIILGAVLAVSLMSSTAMGATEQQPAVKNMKISIWPEYDDPRVMVQYQGEFKEGSSFPALVNFPVPLGAEMSMVCAIQPPNDAHLCQLYDTITKTDRLDISYTLPIPTYYLEYYWDGIKGLPDKSFSFNYVSPYAVDTLTIEVQQPLKATDFKLAQPYASARSDTLGMKYYNYVFNNVTPGQALSIDATYTKSDNKPSVAKQQTTTTSKGPGTYNIILFAGIVLVAVVIAFFAFRRKPVAVRVRSAHSVQSQKPSRMEARNNERERMRRQEPKQVKPSPVVRGTANANHSPAGAGASFCSKCGVKLPPGARFCHACGAKTVEGT